MRFDFRCLFKLLVLMVIFSVLVVPQTFGGRSSQPFYWDGVSDIDVDQVAVFMSDTSQNYNLEIQYAVAIVDLPATTVTVENIPNGTWYFLPVAVDNGIVGDACYQDEIMKTYEVQPGCVIEGFRDTP